MNSFRVRQDLAIERAHVERSDAQANDKQRERIPYSKLFNPRVLRARKRKPEI